jgi:hypothetical protein
MSAPLITFAFNEDDARLAVATARGKIVDCYNAVLEAEKAGANVTTLLGKLNDAGELLSKADLAYSTGNFDSAHEFALQSQAGLNGFIEEANVLSYAAADRGAWDFVFNVVGSLVGAGAVVVGSFFLWSFLKGKYGGGEGVV